MFCGSDNRCIDDFDVGENCSDTKPCKSTLICAKSGTTTNVTQTCAAKKSNGSTCLADTDCTGGICLATVSGTGLQCASSIIYAPSEPACSRYK
jgi:hypothetical protein